MSEGIERVAKVDHRAEAERLMQHPDTSLPAVDATDTAQVYASLAIVEQLERLNETLAVGNLTYADGMVRNG